MLVDTKRIKESLVLAGIEVFRTRPEEIQVAERVRSHIMDSGVRVHVSPDGMLQVRFTARTQGSDYPSVPAAELVARVRAAIGETARTQGFAEFSFDSVVVKDPVDSARTLDVWHEVAYAKTVVGMDEIVESVRWALALERYVMP